MKTVVVSGIKNGLIYGVGTNNDSALEDAGQWTDMSAIDYEFIEINLNFEYDKYRMSTLTQPIFTVKGE